jgi:hypothetical protein
VKVHLHFNHARYGYEIYLYDERGTGRIPYSFNEKGYLGSKTGDEVGYGEETPPTMFLDGYAYDALREAMIGEVIESDDALRDARTIRDRLLTMVETEWQSRQLEKH